MIVDYYESDAGGERNPFKTRTYFRDECGCPDDLVRRYIEDHMEKGPAAFIHKPHNTKYDAAAIQQAFREHLAKVGGTRRNDLSKVDLKKLGHQLGYDGMYHGHMKQVVRKDAQLRVLIEKDELEHDLLYEARRSMIAAAFIMSSGSFRERRNACVRYFSKLVPDWKAPMVLLSVDRFVRTGSVRSNLRNIKSGHWTTTKKSASSFTKYTAKAMELLPTEEEYIQNLQKFTNEVERNKQKQPSKNFDADLRNDLAAAVTVSREVVPKTTTATTTTATNNNNEPMHHIMITDKRSKIFALEKEVAECRSTMARMQQELDKLRGGGVSSVQQPTATAAAVPATTVSSTLVFRTPTLNSD